jgi:hypothetical protein
MSEVLCVTAKLDRQCPLWVKSRHRNSSNQCPLYPQKRTWIQSGCDVRFVPDPDIPHCNHLCLKIGVHPGNSS